MDKNELVGAILKGIICVQMQMAARRFLRQGGQMIGQLAQTRRVGGNDRGAVLDADGDLRAVFPVQIHGRQDLLCAGFGFLCACAFSIVLHLPAFFKREFSISVQKTEKSAEKKRENTQFCGMESVQAAENP
ncbi:MAG: hypothetical protein IJK64_11480 [Clostridia bacterium]|nr:hypothetical protein [Clostridia bacterium]